MHKLLYTSSTFTFYYIPKQLRELLFGVEYDVTVTTNTNRSAWKVPRAECRQLQWQTVQQSRLHAQMLTQCQNFVASPCMDGAAAAAAQFT